MLERDRHIEHVIKHTKMLYAQDKTIILILYGYLNAKPIGLLIFYLLYNEWNTLQKNFNSLKFIFVILKSIVTNLF